MKSSLLLNLPWNDIVKTHRQWFENAGKITERCLRLSGNEDVEHAVEKLVRDSQLCVLFGGPSEGVKLPPKDAPNGGWLAEFWWRRCMHYLSTLVTGLQAALDCQSRHMARDTELLAGIKKLKSELDESFNKMWDYPKLEKMLITRGDLANSHITRLDPDLFSALFLRNRHERYPMIPKALKSLDALLQREVERCWLAAKDGNAVMADDATLFWGTLKLAQLKQENFVLGENVGWPGAVAAFGFLVARASQRITWPGDERHFELTPEIYGETRTRILIVKNCLAFLELVPAEYRDDCAARLQDFTSTQIHRVILDPKIQRHVCLLGIALELSSAAFRLRQVLQGTGGSRSTRAASNPMPRNARTEIPVARLVFFSDRPAIRFDNEEIALTSLQYVCLRVVAKYCRLDIPDALRDNQKKLSDKFSKEYESLKDKIRFPSLSKRNDNPIASHLSSLREKLTKGVPSSTSKNLKELLPFGKYPGFVLKLTKEEIAGLDNL